MMTHIETYNVIAMRRSGHHAIIRWIAGHYNKTVFHNDFGGTHGQWTPELRDSDDNGAGIYEYNDSGSGTCKVCNYEDYLIADMPKTTAGITVLILRDPYNCFASRIHANFHLDHIIDDNAINMWIDNAKAFQSVNVYPISFNQWVIDELYRQKISKDLLRKPYSPDHVQTIPPFGLGSSFDGTKFDGKANQMDLFNRWRTCMNNPEFQRIVNNFDISRLSREIFGIEC